MRKHYYKLIQENLDAGKDIEEAQYDAQESMYMIYGEDNNAVDQMMSNTPWFGEE